MNDTKCVTVIPPCWLRGYRWYNIETGEYYDPPTAPVYVRWRGKVREAKRWLWLWRIVSRVQEVLA